MYLVDSSVWIAHFRTANPVLRDLLINGLVLIHPFVAGELACGSMKNRKQILTDLNALPFATSATHAEVMNLLEQRKLWSRGIGWVDAHLIASALLSHCRLWTLDERLRTAAGSATIQLH